MGILQLLFGKRPDPIPEPEPVQSALSPTFGIAPSAPDNATIEAAEQMRLLALSLAQQAGISDYHAQMTEAVVEQAQRLYGSGVRHQSRLQELSRSRFPIDLMAAGLFVPTAPTQPSKPRDSNIKSAAKKVLGG